MADLTNAERETHLNMSADDRTTWEVFTDDPVMIRKLDAITTAVRTQGEGFIYHLPANQVTLRKPRKPMSRAQRQAATQRLAAARA